jgi:hypothetical protein
MIPMARKKSDIEIVSPPIRLRSGQALQRLVLEKCVSRGLHPWLLSFRPLRGLKENKPLAYAWGSERK